MPANLFVHPLATAEWESVPAATVRLSTKSIWTTPLDDEDGAPDRRIIHARAIFADQPLLLDSLELTSGPGYHKCASGQETDAPTRVVARIPDNSSWRDVGQATEGRLDLGGIETTSFVATVRRARTDGWWPGWNITNTGLLLRGTAPDEWHAGADNRLSVDHLDVGGLPAGVQAAHLNSEIRYSTPYLSVGFRLFSPAWSHFAVDADGDGRVDHNLLQMPRSMDIVRSGVYPSGVYPVLRDQNAEYLSQGPRFTGHDGYRPAGFLASGYEGTTSVKGNEVTYDFTIDKTGQHYVLHFVVEPDRIVLHATRTADRSARAWHSSAWHVATDNRVTPSCVLGELTMKGETGGLGPSAFWHFPRHGSFALSGTGDISWRSDSIRPLDTNTLELKLGETATDAGDYELPAGTFSSRIEFAVSSWAPTRLSAGASPAISRMLNRHGLTALPFRADTATYSNNGASMHCTTSLNDVSAIAVHMGEVLPGQHPMSWVGTSLERWLNGAPSYGSGYTSHGPHRLEDEYVHLAANTLIALGRYLTWDDGDDWFDRHRDRIGQEITDMLDRDVDGDGLVESELRRGISGEHQWSTAWADVLSFGWKDAWANAALYEAWALLAPVMRRHGLGELADRIDAARAALKKAYLPTFLNESTGLIAGWRSHDGALHDYGFSVVVGTACASDLIPVDTARTIMGKLLDAWAAVDLRDLRNGIPLNLWRIPERDIGGVVFGLPLGSYQQGGMSHHSARAVVDALRRTGYVDESDALLQALAETIADDSSFGGLGSGKDWRAWDGAPSGYEGQLVEGFSVLASAMALYGER